MTLNYNYCMLRIHRKIKCEPPREMTKTSFISYKRKTKGEEKNFIREVENYENNATEERVLQKLRTNNRKKN